jgi:hypothetical protein
MNSKGGATADRLAHGRRGGAYVACWRPGWWRHGPTGRRAYLMELDLRYIEVIGERWEKISAGATEHKTTDK